MINTDFDTERAIREYLPQIIHMSLATCQNNKPWVCEVHFVYDVDLNLYFRSEPSRRHSQEIASNPRVAGNIVTQHQKGEKPRGVYFEGLAERIIGVTKDSEVFRLFSNQLGVGAEILEEAQKSDGGQFYKIRVSDFYVFDVRESSPSQKYHLSWK